MTLRKSNQTDDLPSRSVAAAHPSAPDHVNRASLSRKRWLPALALSIALAWIVAAETGQFVPGYAAAIRFGEVVTDAADHIRSAMSDRMPTLEAPATRGTILENQRTLSVSPKTGRRVALIVGIAAYRHAPRLANPRNDAEDLAGALRALGFDVMVGTNLDRVAFYERIGEFAKYTQGADAALFFYAGHGMQLDGENYLLPVDATPRSEYLLKGTAVELQEVLDGMKSSTRLVFLDACRDNPFLDDIARARGVRSSAMSRGLMRVEDARGGMFIAYATAPGDVAADGDGRNSPFTTALKRHIGEPGLEINQLINRVRRTVAAAQPSQRPWHTSSLHDDFYFLPDGSTNGGAGLVVQRPDPAEELWEQTKSSNNAEQFERFIGAYPNSLLAQLARARLDDLRQQSLIAELQANLNAMGFHAGSEDGIPGTQTRKAMASFARVRNLPSGESAFLLEASRQARSSGYQNFQGCHTERSPRTVQETQRVPFEYTEWEEDSIGVEVYYGPVQECIPLQNMVCTSLEQCGSVCEQRVQALLTQARLWRSPAYVDLLARLRDECENRLHRRRDGTRNAKVSRATEVDCACPPSRPFSPPSPCECDYKGRCTFEAPETYTDYRTETLAKTVYDERQVCECLAPEVSGRADCVGVGR